MRIAPSTGTGTSMAALGLRFAFVIGTTFRDLRMAHPRLIYRAGIQSFADIIFWCFPERIRSTGLALWGVQSDGWSGRASTARPGRVGQHAIPPHNRRLHYGDPDGQWTASECGERRGHHQGRMGSDRGRLALEAADRDLERS